MTHRSFCYCVPLFLLPPPPFSFVSAPKRQSGFSRDDCWMYSDVQGCRSLGDRGTSPPEFRVGDRNVVCPLLLARHLAGKGHELPFAFKTNIFHNFLTSFATNVPQKQARFHGGGG